MVFRYPGWLMSMSPVSAPIFVSEASPSLSLPTPAHPTNDNNNLMKLLEKNKKD
jgi:hypothetical protein